MISLIIPSQFGFVPFTNEEYKSHWMMQFIWKYIFLLLLELLFCGIQILIIWNLLVEWRVCFLVVRFVWFIGKNRRVVEFIFHSNNAIWQPYCCGVCVCVTYEKKRRNISRCFFGKKIIFFRDFFLI